MADKTMDINELVLKDYFKIEDALVNRKPFQNFKHIIDHSDYRQDWFEFKHQAIEKKVERFLNLSRY